MTKRRWLKTAIEESKKPQVAMPWTRQRTALLHAPAKATSPVLRRSVATA